MYITLKKLLTFLLAVILSVTFSNSVFAYPQSSSLPNAEYTYYSDGSYTVSVITNETSNNNSYTRATNTVTKSKTSTHYSSSNVKLWYVKVTGTFTYDSKTSKCISSQVSAGSYNNSWKISNKSASTSGSTAIASATAKLYTGTVISQTKQETVKLTCDKNGNFS